MIPLELELEDLGFGPFFATQLDRLERDRPGLVPARIAADGAGIYHLLGCQARLGGFPAGFATSSPVSIARPSAIGSPCPTTPSAPSSIMSCGGEPPWSAARRTRTPPPS